MDTATTYFAPRTCTVVNEGEATRDGKERAAPLRRYANAAAYVLIAEPGAGKTTAFKTEAASQGGVYVTVRNFRTFDDKPKWHDTTLFLDGLDESRAGTEDGRSSLDDIRKKLERLRRPPFRLSCRWADWMAATDKEALKDVSPDGTITVIRLDPLTERNIKDILTKNHGVEDADGFVEAARKRGVDRLLSNPQNLDLLAKSVSQGNWPDSRKETFDQACGMLVREPNGEHLAANPSSADVSLLIEAAGRLCAAQLISGAAGFTLPDRAEPDGDFPAFTEVSGGVRNGTARNVLGTRLFVGVSEGKLSPAHRQIAEFLAAKYVSGLLDGGLSLQRLLALITGFDGELVPSFRNFASWLAVHNKQSRKRLSQLNPSGLIYDGDRRTYSADEKRDIVRNLRRESSWNPWCIRSVSKVSGIGAIVSPELEETFREILTDGERGHEHQSYVMLLMQMLADGEPLPALSDVLEQTVREMLGRTRRRSCAFVMPDRSTCHANPMRDEQFCYFHHPDHKQAAAESRRLGGNRRRREKTIEGAYDLADGLRSADDIQRVVEAITFELLSMESTIARANAILRAAGVAARLLEVADLEAALKDRSPEPSSPFDVDPAEIDTPPESSLN